MREGVVLHERAAPLEAGRAGQKAAAIRAWLERDPRITFHLTPTSAPWTRSIPGSASSPPARLSRGQPRLGQGFVERINTLTAQWSADADPFLWVRTADEILAKLFGSRQRLPNRDARPQPTLLDELDADRCVGVE